MNSPSPRNPYIVGPVLAADDSTMVGRRENITKIVATLRSSRRTLLLQDGMGRIGKTSLVLRAAREVEKAGVLAATHLLDLRALPRLAADAWTSVASAVVSATRTLEPDSAQADPVSLDPGPIGEWLAARCGTDRTVVVVLDELSRTRRIDGHEEAQTAILAGLREIQRVAPLSVLASTGGQILDGEPIVELRAFERLPTLAPLEVHDVEELWACAQWGFTPSRGVFGHIHAVSGGFPLLIQGILSRLFSRYVGKVSPEFGIGRPDVDALLDEVLTSLDFAFERIISGLDPRGRFLLAAYSSAARGSRATSLSPEDVCAHEGAQPPGERLVRATVALLEHTPRVLEEYGLLRPEEVGRYAVTAPMISMWIARHLPPAKVLRDAYPGATGPLNAVEIARLLAEEPNNLNARANAASLVRAAGRPACVEVLEGRPYTNDRIDPIRGDFLDKLDKLAIEQDALKRIKLAEALETDLGDVIYSYVRLYLEAIRAEAVALHVMQIPTNLGADDRKLVVETLVRLRQKRLGGAASPQTFVSHIAPILARDAELALSLVETISGEPIAEALRLLKEKHQKRSRPDLVGPYRILLAGGIPNDASKESLTECLRTAFSAFARRTQKEVEILPLTGAAAVDEADLGQVLAESKREDWLPAIVASPHSFRDPDPREFHALVFVSGRAETPGWLARAEGKIWRSELDSWLKKHERHGIPVVPLTLHSTEGYRTSGAKRLLDAVLTSSNHPTAQALGAWSLGKLTEFPRLLTQGEAALELRRCLRAAVAYSSDKHRARQRWQRIKEGIALLVTMAIVGSATWYFIVQEEIVNASHAALSEPMARLLQEEWKDVIPESAREGSGLSEWVEQVWQAQLDGAPMTPWVGGNVKLREYFYLDRPEPDEHFLSISAFKLMIYSRGSLSFTPDSLRFVSTTSTDVDGNSVSDLPVACFRTDDHYGELTPTCERQLEGHRTVTTCSEDDWASESTIVCLVVYPAGSDDKDKGDTDSLDPIFLPIAPWWSSQEASLFVGSNAPRGGPWGRPPVPVVRAAIGLGGATDPADQVDVAFPLTEAFSGTMREAGRRSSELSPLPTSDLERLWSGLELGLSSDDGFAGFFSRMEKVDPIWFTLDAAPAVLRPVEVAEPNTLMSLQAPAQETPTTEPTYGMVVFYYHPAPGLGSFDVGK